VRVNKLLHLQTLRGLAASLVVLGHAAEAAKVDHWERFAVSSYFGVATFFIISGFIIFKTAKDSFGTDQGFRQFIVKRLIRIFPIYWIATALFVILSPHRAEYSAGEIASSFLLIPHYIASTDGMNPLLGQGWTLHYEFLFYAIFAAGLLLDRRNGLMLTMVVLAALAVCGFWIRPEDDSNGPLTLMQYYSRPIILLFPVGMVLGLVEERLRFSIPFPFAIMLALLAVWFAYCLSMPLSGSEFLMFPMILVVLAFGAFWVFVSLFGRSTEGWAEPVAEAFGDASYSVYLFHTFILSALIRLHLRDAHPVLFIVAAIFGANIFGYLVYVMVERPILRKLRALLLAPKAAVRPAL
jgi:exopolysaccharide production protein ExoZ